MRGTVSDQGRRTAKYYRMIPPPNYAGYSTEDVWDAYYTFFIHAYNLKDWIKNDPNIKIGNSQAEKEKTVESLFSDNLNMQLLQSIANSIKHLTLRKDSRNEFKGIMPIWVDGAPVPSPAFLYSKVRISEDSAGRFELPNDEESTPEEIKSMHPRKLAIKVLATWNKFFRKYGIKGGFGLVESHEKM